MSGERCTSGQAVPASLKSSSGAGAAAVGGYYASRVITREQNDERSVTCKRIRWLALKGALGSLRDRNGIACAIIAGGCYSGPDARVDARARLSHLSTMAPSCVAV